MGWNSGDKGASHSGASHPQPVTKDLKSLTSGSLSQRILEQVVHKEFRVGFELKSLDFIVFFARNRIQSKLLRSNPIQNSLCMTCSRIL